VNMARAERAARARYVRANDPAYPFLLTETKPSVPGYWIIGRDLTDMPRTVGIVGSRNPTPYGIEIAHTLASGLAHAGITIVSGMARGIDAAAHEGALAARGTTIAVLGTGVDNPYPASNRELYERIAANGSVISEQDLGMEGLKYNFPKRNRIIAGLSLAVVVVQASLRSGALSSAAHARENNRDVLAVPGDIRSPVSAGVHELIRDGAGLCTSARDVLDAIGPELARLEPSAVYAAPLPAGLTAVERSVLIALRAGPGDLADVAKRASARTP